MISLAIIIEVSRISVPFDLSGVDQFYVFFGSCFSILKNEWERLESQGIYADQVHISILNCLSFLFRKLNC